jgi:peptidoglycan/xylan/chitin deacetylase (PgdA/CDA1 family)
LTEASPCLLGFGYPAVVFVPTAYIGGRNDFDRDVEPEERICDWDDLRELDRRGVSVQSHGVSHRWYSTLDPAELRDELVRSKEALEDGLSKRVEVLAYPTGMPGAIPAGWQRCCGRPATGRAASTVAGRTAFPSPTPAGSPGWPSVPTPT